MAINADLNTLVYDGIYSSYTDVVNAPSGVSGKPFVLVVSNTSYQICQWLYLRNEQYCYYRFASASGFTDADWKRVVTQ